MSAEYRSRDHYPCRREKRQSLLAKCVIIKRVPPWGSISADSRTGRTLLTIRINGIRSTDNTVPYNYT